jgi:hypothetical protein
MKVQVEGRPDLVRDMKSGAVLNVDNRGLEAYKKTRDKSQLVDRVIDENEKMKRQIESIENKLDYMLQLLNNNK